MPLRGWQNFQLPLNTGVDRREDAPAGTWRELRNMWAPTDDQIEQRPGAVRYCSLDIKVGDGINDDWVDVFDEGGGPDPDNPGTPPDEVVILDPSKTSKNLIPRPIDIKVDNGKVHSKVAEKVGGTKRVDAIADQTVFSGSF